MDKNKISTIMDKILNILKDKKRIEINELVKISGISEKELKTWLKVLEEEGLIVFTYTFTKTYVEWLGTYEEGQAYSAVEQRNYDTMKDEKSADPVEFIQDFSDTTENQEIENNMKKETEKIIDELEKIADKKIMKMSKTIAEPVRVGELEEPKKLSEIIEYEQTKNNDENQTKKSRIQKYLQQIEEKKAEITQLKAEKHKLLEEVYKPLEIKIETQVGAISERIIEKEKALIELEEKIGQLPDKTKKLDKEQEKVIKLEEQSRENLKVITKQIDSVLYDVNIIKKEIEESVSENMQKIEYEFQKLEEMQQTFGKIDDAKKQIEAYMGKIEEEIKKQQQMFSMLNASVEELEIVQEETQVKAGTINEKLEKEKQKLDVLTQEIEKLDSLEKWIKDYRYEYENKMHEFSEYLRNNATDFDRLKKEIDQDFLNRYMEMLEKTFEEYETELDGVQTIEKTIDTKIQNSKKKIAQLMKNAKKLMKEDLKQRQTDSKKMFNEISEKTMNLISIAKTNQEERQEITSELKESAEKISKVKLKHKKRHRKK